MNGWWNQEPLTDDALSELLERLRPRLGWLLSRFRIPAEDAEDLVQEVLLNLIRRWGEVREPEAFVVSSLRFQCLMYWRSRRRRLYRLVDDTLLEEHVAADSGAAWGGDLAHDLRRLLPQIPRHCRAVLKLRYEMGLGPGEVARELGYRTSSMSNVTTRCVAALTRQLVAGGY